MNRKASTTLSLDFLIGLIIAVLLFSTVFIVGYQFYKKESDTKESFNRFYDSFSNLKDQETDSFPLYLSDKSFLVIFTDKNFDNGDVELDKPESCGEFPCVCICNKDFMLSTISEDNCEKGNLCSALTQFSTNTVFVGEDSNQIFIPGTSSSLQTVYYKREGDNIYLTTASEFVSEEIQQEINQFQETLTTLSTISSKTDCKYTLDLTYLEDNYAVEFKKDKTNLIDLNTKRTLFTSEKSFFDKEFMLIKYFEGEDAPEIDQEITFISLTSINDITIEDNEKVINPNATFTLLSSEITVNNNKLSFSTLSTLEECSTEFSLF